ncbi:L,D-transpeptidase [Bordetella genomosp. 4]|uniref:L,D-TPase catalytic domain-containing protein n=1 Tax=Bordetella genomosp. 4 TaxID=463044 RepID=A0A261U2S1_9BORD|nr:L,D-transpeptidase [Bordetella genomosp. 4]OZI56248.1 hypothetical protein CAL20_12455 [Bordetella genomosp. 4]
MPLTSNAVYSRRAFLGACFSTALVVSAEALALDVKKMSPGDFIWHPEAAPAGPLVVLVSLDEQRVYVYRNGVAIGVSTISSGKPGHETPTGVFTILQKDRDHRSNIYNNAPMPYMQRLTWSGIALHGGAIPGHPASHGCVRLPNAFAQRLFAETKNGDTVVVADARVDPSRIAFPALLAPVAPGAAASPVDQIAQRGKGDFWDESISPSGPLSIVLSLSEQRFYVLRNGIAIGSSWLHADSGAHFDGALLLVMGTGTVNEPSPFDPTQLRHQWASYPLFGTPPSLTNLENSIKAQPEFIRRVYRLLTPGTTMLITSLPAVRPAPDVAGAGPTERVLESDVD